MSGRGGLSDVGYDDHVCVHIAGRSREVSVDQTDLGMTRLRKRSRLARPNIARESGDGGGEHRAVVQGDQVGDEQDADNSHRGALVREAGQQKPEPAAGHRVPHRHAVLGVRPGTWIRPPSRSSLTISDASMP
jgi:hypothetical protein